MRFERITDSRQEMYGKALELYGGSFPVHEQREAASQREILRDEAYFFDLIYDEESFVGLILFWETETFIYVEHFCILPEMRNRNYGKRALELLGRSGKTVILEIDPPVDELSKRRKGFYERCGFRENAYPHIHPPYHRGNAGHPLVVMTCPRAVTEGEYREFRQYLEHHIMENVYE